MKKVTSAALLALKLTWKAALLCFLIAGGVQTFSVYRWLMPDGVPLQVTFGFETMLQSAVQPHGKLFAVALLCFLCLRAAESKGSKTVYTMNRLGLTENTVTLIFGGVFTGYFLLYWFLQIAAGYGFFVWYSQFSLVSSNAFMLACWRSEWLHLLLPLEEWWNYLRNLILCGSFGFSAAIGSQLMRRGKLPLASLIPVGLCLFLLPGQIGSFTLDIALSVILTAFTVGYFFVLKGELANEDL